MSGWQTHLSWEAQRAHFQWDTTGRVGPGRLQLTDADVTNAQLEGGCLQRGVFIRCNFGAANLQGSALEEAELNECLFTDAHLGMGDWDRVVVNGGVFERCILDLTHLDGARIQGVVFRSCSLARVTADGARVTETDFTRAVLTDARFEGAVLERCSFVDADLSRTLPLPKGQGRAVAFGTVFDRCDFQGANLEGLKLRDTRFVDCRMAGVRGRPRLEGPVQMTTVDVPADALLARWMA